MVLPKCDASKIGNLANLEFKKILNPCKISYCRYCFLAFGFDERVVANRDNCRLLLIRLKMDGWALGRTKVFLKYYHVEFLSKMYEEQLRKIIMVQACVRRWLAKIRFRKQKWQFAVSVVTLQRHIRGWLSRKHLLEEMKKKQEEEESTVLQKAQGFPRNKNTNLQKRDINLKNLLIFFLQKNKQRRLQLKKRRKNLKKMRKKQIRKD